MNFDSSWMGSAISAGASHINLLASSLWNQRQNRKAYEQQSKLQEDAQAFTHDERLEQQQWEESMYNDYFSPQARIAQLREAGVNPNDAAAALAGSSASMPSAPSGASVGIGSAPPPNYIDLSSVANNNMSAFADAVKKLAEANKTNIDAKNAQRGYDDTHRLTNAQITKIINDADLSDAQATQLRQLTPGLVKLNDTQQKLLLTQIDELQAKIATYDDQIKLLKAQAGNQNADAAIKQAELGLTKARSDFKEALYLTGVDADADWKEKLINFIAAPSSKSNGKKFNIKDLFINLWNLLPHK